MIINGVVVSGVVRGEELIKIYSDRILHILGFRPFSGTLDIQTEKNVALEDYATRKIEHVLLNGKSHVYAYLVPVHLKIIKNSQEFDCWLIKTAEAFSKNLVEVISNENLRAAHSIEDGDAVEITFFKKVPKRKKPVTRFLTKIAGKETRISR